VTTIDNDPFVDALIAKLTADLPDTYFVGDGEGPKVPGEQCPAVVLYADPGKVSGHPFAPGSRLTGTLMLHGIGETRKQAQNAARAGRDALLGDFTAGGVQYVVTPDDSSTPRLMRDDRLTPALFVQPVELYFRTL
jgi:hypothetical protein